MNTLLRKSEDEGPYMKDDALCMFRSYFRHIPKELRKDLSKAIHAMCDKYGDLR